MSQSYPQPPAGIDVQEHAGSLVVRFKGNSSGRTFKHYHLFIAHETADRKRLFNFRGDEASAEFIKDVVRDRLG